MKSKYFIYFLVPVMFFIMMGAEAQQSVTVSGVVTSFRRYPLNNVKVVASKSGEVALTDSSGRFSISVFNKDILTASAMGFSDRRIRIGSKRIYVIDVLYKDNASNFNEAVSNRHISENALRKAIFDGQSVNRRDYSVYTTIYELIENEIYNVSVRGTDIYNKKIRSFDQTPQVLYVVDNKIVPDISFVAPNYVATIEFIDDVGATIYGVSGANGVIRITLK